MKFNKEITIQGKNISILSPTFVIAEAGVNHGGDIAIAKQLIFSSGFIFVMKILFKCFHVDNYC